MRKSKILEKFRSGQIARLCVMDHYISVVPHLAAKLGYDGVWVDAEHRTWDPREIEALLAFHHAADIDCVWRPSTVERNPLYRLLEDGATGLLIPHVSSADQAQALVRATRFPPLGDRGIEFSGFDAGFGLSPNPSYLADANRETCLIAQIETLDGLRNVEAIAAIEGVDALFIGIGDLSVRLNCKATVDDPIMRDAQRAIAAAARRCGKAWGRPAFDSEDVRWLKSEGAQLVVFGGTWESIMQGLTESSRRLDEALGR